MSNLDKYFNLLSLNELEKAEDTEVDWIVDGLLLRGGTSILAAREKSGKSTLARQIGLAVCSQKPVLGRSATPCDILYLALDDRKKLFKRHISKLKRCGDWPSNFRVHFQKVRGDKIEAVDAFMAEYPDTGLIIVDTWQKFFTDVKNTNDYNEVVKAMRPWSELAEQYNIHIMYLHHMNKGGDDVEDISKVMGSAGITADVDAILTMYKKEAPSNDGKFNNYLSATVVGGEHIYRKMLVWDREKEKYELQKF